MLHAWARTGIVVVSFLGAASAHPHMLRAAGPDAAAAKREVIDVWPGKAPGEKGDIGQEVLEKNVPPKQIQLYKNVSAPTITVFPAPADNNTGAAVLICPGGGYTVLAWDLEGTEVARWLNGLGVNAFVLKYRVPRRKDRAPHEAPLQDAQRAMSIVRSRASDWKIDPARIGILGFSAGGHLSAATCCNYDRRSYKSIDKSDAASCRPDFGVLVYPAYLQEKGALKPEIRVNKKTPPIFFAHAGNDRVSPVNSAAMYIALKQAGVSAELHIYSQGGHGFGLRASDDPVSTWPDRCAAWLKREGWLKAKK